MDMLPTHQTIDDELAEIFALRLRLQKSGIDPLRSYDKRLEGMIVLLEATKLYLPQKPLH